MSNQLRIQGFSGTPGQVAEFWENPGKSGLVNTERRNNQF